MPPDYRFVVAPRDTATRLDRFLTQQLPDTFSRAAVQRAIEGGSVTVEGKPAKAHRRLKAGEAVIARFGDGEPDVDDEADSKFQLIPEPIPLTVVFEDEHVLVVNKPAGLVTHPAPGHWAGTLVNAVLWHLGYREAGAGAASALPRAGIVHRLDKDTSGLLVIAKTDVALRLLARQLKDRSMSRRYVAVVERHLPVDRGTVHAAIGRHAKDRKVMTVRFLGGRDAVTHYRVLGRDEARVPYSIIEAWLETGRTHQIRVHLAHLGHPVLGDPVYSRHSAAVWQSMGIARQLLHAHAITFVHPATGQTVTLRAPIPDDMRPWIPPAVMRRELSAW